MGFFRRSPDLGSTPLRLIPKRTAEDVKAEQERGREFTIEELRERRAQEEEAKKEKELQERKKKREEEEKKEEEKKKKTAHPPHDDHSGEHDKHGAKSEHGDSAHHPEAVTHHGHAEEGGHKEHGDHGHEEKKEKKPGVGNFDVGKYILLKKATDFHKAATNHTAIVDHHDIDEYRNIRESVSSLNKDAKRETFDFVNARFTTLIHHPTQHSKEFEKDFFLTASKFFPKEIPTVLFDKQKKQIIEDIFEKTKKSQEPPKKDDNSKSNKVKQFFNNPQEIQALDGAYKEFSSHIPPNVKKIISALEVVTFPSFAFRVFRSQIIEALTCFYPSTEKPKNKKLDELVGAITFFNKYRPIEQNLFVEKQEKKKTEAINKQISKTKPLPTKTGGFKYKIVNPNAFPFIHTKTNFPTRDGGKIAYAIEFPNILPQELNLVNLIENILEEYEGRKKFSETTKKRIKEIQNQIKDEIIKFPISTPSLDRLIKAFLALDFDEIRVEELPVPKVIRELQPEETTEKPVLNIVDEEEEEETDNVPKQLSEAELKKRNEEEEKRKKEEERIKTEFEKRRKKERIGSLLYTYLEKLHKKLPSQQLTVYIAPIRKMLLGNILDYVKTHPLPKIKRIDPNLRDAILGEDLDKIEKILESLLEDKTEEPDATAEDEPGKDDSPTTPDDRTPEDTAADDKIEAKQADKALTPSGRAEVEEEKLEYVFQENLRLTLENGIQGDYTGRLKVQTQESKKVFLPDTTGIDEKGHFFFSQNKRPYKLTGQFEEGKIVGEVTLFYDLARGLSVEYIGTVNSHTLLPESDNAVAHIKTYTDDSQSVRTFYGRFVDGKMDVKNGRFDPPFQKDSGEIFLNRITGEILEPEDNLPDVDVGSLPHLEETGPLPKTSKTGEDDFSDLSFAGEDDTTPLPPLNTNDPKAGKILTEAEIDKLLEGAKENKHPISSIRPPLSPEAAKAIQELITPVPEKPSLLSDAEQAELLKHMEEEEKNQKKREKALEFYTILTARINELFSILTPDEGNEIKKYLQTVETIEPDNLLQHVKDNPLPQITTHHTDVYEQLRDTLVSADSEKLEKWFEKIFEDQKILSTQTKAQEVPPPKEEVNLELKFLKENVADALSRLLPLYRSSEKENIQKIIETLTELNPQDHRLFEVYSEVTYDLSQDLQSTDSKLYVQTIKILEQFGRTKNIDVLRRHFEAILNNQSVKVALARRKQQIDTPTKGIEPVPPISIGDGEDTKHRVRKFLLYMEETGLGTEFENILEKDSFRKRLLSKGAGTISEQISETLRDELGLVKERLMQKGIPAKDIDNIEKIQIIYGVEEPDIAYYKLLHHLSQRFSYNTGR